jgi:hypothetical protein
MAVSRYQASSPLEVSVKDPMLVAGLGQPGDA